MVREQTFQRKRTFWSDEEDARLVELVEVYGIHNWPEVAGSLQGRDSKSCSLRWRYFLAPHIIRSTDQKLSDWEVAVLVWAQREYGNKWRTIVDNYLPWRSPNDLKNYCNQYVNGKHNHVMTQNKLLLQNVPLQTLLAQPPADVQERWRHVKSVRDSPKGQQRPGKKGTRGLSYIIRQAVKLKAQRTQPYPKPSTGAPAAEASSGIFKRDSDGLCGPPGMYESGSTGPYRPAAAGYSQQPVQYGTFSMPCMQQPQQQRRGQQQVQQLQPPPLTGSNSSGSDSFTSHGMPYGSSPTYHSSGSSMGQQQQQQGCYGYVQGLNISMDMDVTLNVAAGVGMAGAAATGMAGPAGQAPMQQQQLPPCWGAPLDCSPPAALGGSEGSAVGQQACFTPGSASSCFTSTGFSSMGAMSSGMAQPYSSAAMPGSSCPAAATTAPGLPAPQGAFGAQGAGGCMAGSFTASGFAGSSFSYASEQLQCPGAQHPAELQWQEAPDFSHGNSSSSSHSSSSFGAPVNGLLDYSPPAANHTFSHCQAAAAAAAAAAHTSTCNQHVAVTGLLPPPQSMHHQAVPFLQQPHHQQQQAFNNTPYQPASLQGPQHLKLPQELVAPARTSGTGAGAAAAPPGQPDSSPPDSIEGVALLGLDEGEDEDLEGIADLLGSDSGDDWGAGGGCGGSRGNGASASFAAAAAAAAGAAGAYLGQEESLALPAPAGAAEQGEQQAAGVAAGEGTLQGVLPLEQDFSLDIPSDNEGLAEIDFEALLDASGDEACDEAEFALSGDEFELLAQGSGW